MIGLIYFLLFLYAVAGIATAVYVLTTGTRSNGTVALLAGLFWPLFWITGQNQRNRRIGGGSDRYLP